jgi:cathepsin L
MKFISLSIVVLFSFSIILSRSLNIDQRLERFESWKRKFKKNYQSSMQENVAKEKFLQNIQEIDEHNARFDEGKETFMRDTWMRSDMSYDEKMKLLTAGSQIHNVNSNLNPSEIFLKIGLRLQSESLPTYVNWVEKGLVHEVVDQDRCGSCYAFAAVGVLESVALRKNISTKYSVQQIVDCNKSTYGCGGGDPMAALKYSIANGLATRENYPFTAKKGKCQNYPKQKILAKVFTENLRGNEQRLMSLSVKRGPIVVAINTPPSFMNYKFGVYSNAKCSKSPEHAVILVGYGTDPQYGPYWLVKNSWGTTWGEKGYVRMARGRKGQVNLCGIANNVWYAA